MNTQPTLFETAPKPILPGRQDIDGMTYEPQRDYARLVSLHDRVFRVMGDGAWRTVDQIRAVTGGSESGVKARLRDFRKPKFGGYEVPKRYRGDGLWEYCLMLDGRGE